MATWPCLQARGLLVSGSQACHKLVRPGGRQQSDAKGQHCGCMWSRNGRLTLSTRKALYRQQRTLLAASGNMRHLLMQKAAVEAADSRCTWVGVASGGQVLMPPLQLCLLCWIMAAVDAIGNAGSCVCNNQSRSVSAAHTHTYTLTAKVLLHCTAAARQQHTGQEHIKVCMTHRFLGAAGH